MIVNRFDTPPRPPQFFGNVGYLLANGIFKTTDNGESWIKIKTLDKCLHRIHFFDDQIGLVISCAPDQEVFRTIDGGITWIKYFTPQDYKHNSPINKSSKDYHYLTNLEGELWKYIDE